MTAVSEKIFIIDYIINANKKKEKKHFSQNLSKNKKGEKKVKSESKVQKVMPIIMLVFVLALSMQEAFNICAPIIAEDFKINSSDVSFISAVALLTMGVANIVYTALSDFISIKKLLVSGIAIQVTGSLAGIFFSNSVLAVIFFRAIQMAGGSCAFALLILTATRYLNENIRMKYYGFNGACFSGGQMLGILFGGIFATYFGWRYLFIVPAMSVVCIPFIIKYLPEDSKEEKRKIDFTGIFLMATLALFISLYFNTMNSYIFLISILVAGVFLFYINKNKNAFITIEFFKNWKYMLVILVVLITYLTQGSYSFLFSFMVSKVHGIEPSKISMILLPSYAVSMIIGIFGSKITQKIGITKTLVTALGNMALGLVLGSIFLDKSIVVLILISCLFNGGFAILYTPVMTLVINSLPEKMRGTGLGFFNLSIKIASSTGIVITGKLLTLEILKNQGFINNMSKAGMVYSNILLIFLVIICVSFITVNIVKKFLIK